MCSWCWGFSLVIQRLKESFPANDIRFVLTPFRIDTTEPMGDALRNYVLGQWQKVYQTTGQVFDFGFAMPVNFIYNTRLACFAIKAFSKQLPQQEFEYLNALQYAFYTKNKDLTKEAVLIDIANHFAVDINIMLADMNTKDIASVLEQDFNLCQQLAIYSYPTLMTEKDGNYAMLASGYMPYEELAAMISANVTS